MTVPQNSWNINDCSTSLLLPYCVMNPPPDAAVHYECSHCFMCQTGRLPEGNVLCCHHCKGWYGACACACGCVCVCGCVGGCVCVLSSVPARISVFRPLTASLTHNKEIINAESRLLIIS